MQLRVAMWVGICGLLAASTAHAQATPPAGAPPGQPAPPAKKITASLVAGFSFETGSTEMYATGITFNVGVRQSAKTNISFEFDHTHASTKLAEVKKRTVLSNMQVGHVKFEHDARRNIVAISQTTITHDEVRRIDHRFEEFVGVGATTGDRDRVRFRVIPIAAFTVQDKNLELEDNTQQGVGVLQDLTAKLNAMWSFDEHIVYRQYLTQDDDYALNGSAALNGRITSKIGLQLAFIHSHENLVVPGTQKRYQKVQIGLSYTF